jgi:glycosyltransferase involved in cell wall biosynthesis
MPPRVSVAIESYLLEDSSDGLVDTIAALERQTYPREDMEILIAVDAEDEGFSAALARRWPAVEIVPAAEPSYFGMKRALAAAASGDIVAYIDSDCVPAEDWIERIERNLRDAAISAGRTQYPPDETFALTLSLVDFGVASPDPDGNANFFNSNNVGFRREVLERTNFDRDIRRAAADYLLSRQLRAAGERIAYDSEQFVEHHHPGLRGAVMNRLRSGYNAVFLGRLDPSRLLPETRLAAFGPFFPLALWASRVIDDARRLSRNRRLLGVRARDLPLHVGAIAVLRLGDLAGAAMTKLRPDWGASRFGW